MSTARRKVKKSRFAIVALGICALIPAMGYAQTGWVRGKTPIACAGIYCQGWEDLDRNGYTARIAAGGGKLYQLQYSGAIWEYPAVPCTSSCPGWWPVGYDPTTKKIYADGDLLYQLRSNGSVWRYTGTGENWQSVYWLPDGPGQNYPATVDVAVGGGNWAVLRSDGEIEYHNPRDLYSRGDLDYISTTAPNDAVAITVSGDGSLYRLRANGTIELFQPNLYGGGTWLMLDNNPATIAIAAGRDGTELYQLHFNGWIWHNTHPCQGTICDGWERLDNNPATVRILATAGELYQLHSNGSLYRYTRTPCSGDSCPGWELLLHDSVGGIAADGSNLYELNGQVIPMIRQRVCDSCL